MNKSFTLIEILVVIVVIGILSSFILVITNSITNDANIAKGKIFINSMDSYLLTARVSQWKFDETSGASAYDSWGTNAGTLSGTVPLAQFQTLGCPSNNCLSFDGNDYVGVGTFNPSNTALTINAWIKWNTFSIGKIVSKRDAWAVGSMMYDLTENTATGNQLVWSQAGQNTNNEIFSYVFSTGKWYSIVITHDGSSLEKLYVNGINVDTNPFLSFGTGINAKFNIGSYQDGAGAFFNGYIDDFRIYNQVISTSQIQQNYFIGINKLYKNNGITLSEFNQRIVELKTNLSKYEE